MRNRMKKILILLCLLWAGASTVCGQGPTEEQMIETIGQVAQKLKSMHCDFVQTKQLKMLNEKMVSYGQLTYQQTDKLRWEYTTPYQYTFVLNGSQILIKKGEREDKIDVNQSKMFKEIARIMMNTVVGNVLNSPDDFKASAAAAGGEYVVTLIAQRKDMRKMFKEIKLHYNVKAGMVQQIELTEQNNDVTLIELKNVKTNVSIQPSVFSID